MASSTDFNMAMFELDQALQRLKSLKDLNEQEREELLTIISMMESVLCETEGCEFSTPAVLILPEDDED